MWEFLKLLRLGCHFPFNNKFLPTLIYVWDIDPKSLLLSQ